MAPGDVELLELHRANGDDEAFAQLVRRHAGWVHGMARRRLKDEHRADDVVQAVFILLHRKRPRVPNDRALMRWLHRAAWYATKAAARAQQRREHHETEAAMIRDHSARPSDSDDSIDWQQLAPLLDDLVGRLSRRDREAILLRYYRRMTFVEMAAAMQSTEEAVRKRVDRAIEKLRAMAARHGVAAGAPSAALGVMMDAQLGVAAPPGVVAATTGAALGGGSVAAASFPIVTGAMTMMVLAKAKVAAVVVLSVMTVGGAALVTAQATRALDRAGGQQWARLAPFTAARFEDQTPHVQVESDVWHELVAINDVPAAEIVKFSREKYGQLWDKRFAEDLVEVMSQMNHPPGATVNLKLRNLETGEATEMRDVSMTHEKRQKLWDARNQEQWPKLAPFTAVRWNRQTPHVQVESDVWYELLAIDEVSTADIVKFSQQRYDALWDKRFEEDLVEVMNQMNHPPGRTVNLKLRDLKTDKTVELRDVPMTNEKRQTLRDARERAERASPLQKALERPRG